MFAYLIEKTISPLVESWPEAEVPLAAGLRGQVNVDGKTLFYDPDCGEHFARVDSYGDPVKVSEKVSFLPPKERCGIGNFLRPGSERPQCIAIRLPVSSVRDAPMVLNVPISQCQPRKILWGKARLDDEPAGAYYESCKCLMDASSAVTEARIESERDSSSDAEAAAYIAALTDYQERVLEVVQLAIPLAYAVTDELMDWGQWFDEADIEPIALAALGVDPKKAAEAIGEIST